MGTKPLSDTCVFAFIPDLEPIWGTICLLMGGDAQALCAQLYGTHQLQTWKRTYPFLFEAFQPMEKAPELCMMDFILDMNLEEFTLEGFHQSVLALPPEVFIWRQLELEHVPGAHLSVVQQALTQDDALEKVYGWVAERGIGFLPFSAFCRQSRRFIQEFFQLAQGLRTSALDSALQSLQPRIQQLYQSICQGIQEGDPLAVSQTLMGKTFRNRDPYEQFIFLPSYLLPGKACRYFHATGEHKRQILFLSLRSAARTQEDTIKILKVISDPTRYQILTILAQQGPMRGLDIAKAVSLATSTVSHHMEQMKDSGLITQEPVKNAKYYGLSKHAIKALLDDIANDLQIE